MHTLMGDETVMKAIVGKRGQVTIPKTLRHKLGIRPGMVLEFTAKDGALVVRKAGTDPVSKMLGCLGRRIETDQFISSLRGGMK